MATREDAVTGSVPSARRRSGFARLGWLRWAGAALLVLFALWLGLSWGAERVTLHPARWGIGPSPAARGWTYQDVSFKDAAGLTLRGWWIPGTNHRTVVMVHGWTSSRRETMEKSGYLHAAGYNLLLFDLRGSGQSDGSYTTIGYAEPDDVRAAVGFAHARDHGPIALVGYSMGGSVAVAEGARDPRVTAVVEDSGFSSLLDVVSARFHTLTGLPAWPLLAPLVGIGQVDLRMSAGDVRPVRDATHLHKPLLAIVGTNDQVVPPSEGLALYRATQGPRQLLVVPGAGHTGAYAKDGPTYERTVLDFLSRSLA